MQLPVIGEKLYSFYIVYHTALKQVKDVMNHQALESKFKLSLAQALYYQGTPNQLAESLHILEKV